MEPRLKVIRKSHELRQGWPSLPRQDIEASAEQRQAAQERSPNYSASAQVIGRADIIPKLL
jgi:hypothetical protein